MMEVKIDDMYMRSKELYCILAEDQNNKLARMHFQHFDMGQDYEYSGFFLGDKKSI